MAYRLLPSAEAELDDVWLYAARASGSIEIANRVIDAIADTLFTLGQYPQMGRLAIMNCGPVCGAFPLASM
jgi:plasmid stabilization system protein ParE